MARAGRRRTARGPSGARARGRGPARGRGVVVDRVAGVAPVEPGVEVRRRGRDEAQRALRQRVVQRERARVEHEARPRGPSVERVARDGGSGVRELDARLVGAARLELELEQRALAVPREDLTCVTAGFARGSRPARRASCRRGRGRGVAQRRGPFFRPPGDRREVGLLDAPPSNCFANAALVSVAAKSGAHWCPGRAAGGRPGTRHCPAGAAVPRPRARRGAPRELCHHVVGAIGIVAAKETPTGSSIASPAPC